ncbi:uncharacterized protein AMSG_00860 [Thecamonas trahens ATCC 50062]|uniref:Bud22 domain-containing protein n=1 Tax=Thecamonas trahens ATCC 50062 TaxID=461836 RepID=A0A0L0DEY4_THETB|nr:hypothetical protein AMSG_00860 [Thecamonas trahens ATCC 50062]KNC50701.1 hypothetical protein AMSG_00860 [Thecamonas trahens ATCC 50062]|eukprot:XP_013762578.1 hypothetical protein AMSG_00860 [Thecamonas trahens ATCC 50062]
MSASIKNLAWEISKLEAACGYYVSIRKARLLKKTRKVRRERTEALAPLWEEKQRQKRAQAEQAAAQRGSEDGSEDGESETETESGSEAKPAAPKAASASGSDTGSDTGSGSGSASNSQSGSSSSGSSSSSSSSGSGSGAGTGPLAGKKTGGDGDGSGSGSESSGSKETRRALLLAEAKRVREEYYANRKKLAELRRIRAAQRAFTGLTRLWAGIKSGMSKAKVKLIRKIKKLRKEKAAATELAKQEARLEALKAASTGSVFQAWTRREKLKKLLSAKLTWYPRPHGANVTRDAKKFVGTIIDVVAGEVNKVARNHGYAIDSAPQAPATILELVASRPEAANAKAELIGLLDEEYAQVVHASSGGKVVVDEPAEAERRPPPVPVFDDGEPIDDGLFVASLAAAAGPPQSKRKRTHTAESSEPGAEPPAKKKRKKNRMGQRDRQRMAEARFGENAKHVQRQAEEYERRQRKFQRRAEAAQRAELAAQAKAKAQAQAKPAKPPKKLHPSWEAKKARKAAVTHIDTAPANPKVVKFDDDDE